MTAGKLQLFLLHAIILKALSMETSTNSKKFPVDRLARNTANDENLSFLVKGSVDLNDWSPANYNLPHGKITFNRKINENEEKIVRKEEKNNITNQALLSDDVNELFDNHLIQKRDSNYLENAFKAPQDADEVSKYMEHNHAEKLKKPETTEPKLFRGSYEEKNLDRFKYAQTEDEQRFAGYRSEYGSMEKNGKISKAHKRSNNAIKKRTQNKSSSRSRKSLRGVRKTQNNVKPSEASLNKYENSEITIGDTSRSQLHHHESSNNLISENKVYVRNHKKRSSAENSENENADGYSPSEALNSKLLMNTNRVKENLENNQNDILKFKDYDIGRYDSQKGESMDYQSISEKPVSSDDDINLYLDNFDMFPNSSRRISNGYMSKSIPSKFSKYRDHIKNIIHVNPTVPVLNADDNNSFKNVNFTLPDDVLVNEPNKIDKGEPKGENPTSDIMKQFKNHTLSEITNGDNNMTCDNNQAINKNVFEDQTTEMEHINYEYESSTTLEVNTFPEMTVSDFTEFNIFSESTMSTTEVQLPEPQETSSEKEMIETNKKDDSGDNLANEVILKVLKKVQENEILRDNILPSLQINPDDIKSRKQTLKNTCTVNTKSVINKMSHELESLVEKEIHETECLVLSPQQRDSLTRLLEFSKKEENIMQNNDEGRLRKSVKSRNGDTDTSFAEAMTKKMETLKHLLSQYDKLSEDEKLKVHNVHEYLIEQLNNVYRLINLEESHGYETDFDHYNNQNVKPDSNSPWVDLQKTNSDDSTETSKEETYNGVKFTSDDSPTSDHSQHESSVADSLRNILDTLKKHINKNLFNKEQKSKTENSDTKKNTHFVKIRNTKEISKRSKKSRTKRKSEHQNQDLKTGSISSAYYKLALLAKGN